MAECINASTPTKKRSRDANLDLLRIFSMLLIIFLHSIDHSGVMEQAEFSASWMYIYVRFTYALTQVCVNCYVLLSGYYLVKSKFKLQKLAALWIETVFYSLAFRLVFIFAGLEAFSPASLLSCFVPFLTGRYWFITIYVGMYLLSPFLNLCINAMNKKQHFTLIVLLVALFSVWSSLHPSMAGMNSGGGWGLAWFVVLYIIAAWFRLYYTPNNKYFLKLSAFILIPLVIALGQFAAKHLGIGIIQTVLSFWFKYNSAPVVVMTLCLFVAFLNIRISNGVLTKIICTVSPLTFGVYLIHAHANVSPWLWETLNLPPKMGSFTFIFIQIGCTIGIFIACIAIEAVYKFTIGRIEKCSLVNKVSNKINDIMLSLIHSITEKM